MMVALRTGNPTAGGKSSYPVLFIIRDGLSGTAEETGAEDRNLEIRHLEAIDAGDAAEIGNNLFGPELHRPAADGTDHMAVVNQAFLFISDPSVEKMMLLGDSRLAHQLHVAPDGGNADAGTTAADKVIDFLGRKMAVRRIESIKDRPPLFGHTQAVMGKILFEFFLSLIHPASANDIEYQYHNTP